jgi:hypothetical protein
MLDAWRCLFRAVVAVVAVFVDVAVVVLTL